MTVWKTPEQKHSSKKTSIRQLPAGFKIVQKYYGWEPGTINLDIGGGKFDEMTENLAKLNVTNCIYDPYNRTEEENQQTISICADGGADTVTIFNVLNVIMEEENQLLVLKQAHNALKIGGFVYIRAAYMNKAKVSGVTKSGTFQHHKKQEEYLEVIHKVFPNAVKEHGIIVAKKLA